jgi:hypothetical protein
LSRFPGRISGDREVADRDQVDCYLETAEPRNAEFYARHGFVVENPALQLVSDGPAHITCGAGRRQRRDVVSIGLAEIHRWNQRVSAFTAP